MNFSSATKVIDVLNACETVERERAENRDKISRGINGFPPLSPEKAKQMGLKVNISWLEETVLAKQAALQYTNAFQSQQNYFTVSIPSAPVDKRMTWEQMITQFINKPLKKSREYASVMDNTWASVVAHGVAPKIWLSTDKWIPDFIPLSDFRVATDTDTSLKNLVWFGVRRYYTVGELVQRVFGKYADEGWDRAGIIKILAAYWNVNWETVQYDWANNPEKMTELVKQNISFYTSDAVPVITLWHFYHLETDDSLSGKWMMKVVPDKVCRGVESGSELKFLFNSEESIASCIDELLHIQFGDLNGTPPFKIHSVRSLGFLLHESCFWMNLFRCRTFQAAWENFNMLWRSADGSPKARAQFLELFHKGYVPNEVTILKREEKNEIDKELVEFVMSQTKQLMGEASASYTQDIDTGTQKEQTLGEAHIKLQQANAMMTGLLTVGARNQIWEYREICRRFCIQKSMDPDVRKFRENCKQAGIPMSYLNVDLWDISCDMPLGSGNQAIELAQAQQLMNVRSAHGPDAQQKILHIFDAAVTKNPKLAQQLAPIGGKKDLSDGQSWASAVFGTLMQGVPVPQRSDLNPIDQAKTLLGMSAQVVKRISATDNVGTAADVMGLGMVMAYVNQLAQELEQDKSQKAVTKQITDSLGKLSNMVRAMAQRQQQAGKQAGQHDVKDSITIAFKDLNEDTKNAVLQSIGLPPSKQPQVDPDLVKASGQLQIAQEKHQQKQQMQDQSFAQEQHRENLRTQADVRREMVKHNVKMAAAQEQAKIATKSAKQSKSKSK